MKTFALFCLCLAVVCLSPRSSYACGDGGELLQVTATGVLVSVKSGTSRTVTGYLLVPGGTVELDCRLSREGQKLVEGLTGGPRVEVKGRLELRTKVGIRVRGPSGKFDRLDQVPVIVVESLKIVPAAPTRP